MRRLVLVASLLVVVACRAKARTTRPTAGTEHRLADLVDPFRWDVTELSRSEPYSATKPAYSDFSRRRIGWIEGDRLIVASVKSPRVDVDGGFSRPASPGEYEVLSVDPGPRPRVLTLAKDDTDELAPLVGESTDAVRSRIGPPAQSEAGEDRWDPMVIFWKSEQAARVEAARSVATVSSAGVITRAVFEWAGDESEPDAYGDASQIPGGIPASAVELATAGAARSYSWEVNGKRWSVDAFCPPLQIFDAARDLFAARRARPNECRIRRAVVVAGPGERKRGKPWTADPQPIERIPPRFPPFAKQVMAMGRSVFRVVIDKQGSVSEIILIRSNPYFDLAGARAIARWRYAPVVRDGAPTEWAARVTLNFRLR